MDDEEERKRAKAYYRKNNRRGITRHGSFASDRSQTYPGEYNVIFGGEDTTRCKVCTNKEGRVYRYGSESTAAEDARKFHHGEKEAYVITSGTRTEGGGYSSSILRVDNGRPPAEEK